jgi:uncharacterized protein
MNEPKTTQQTGSGKMKSLFIDRDFAYDGSQLRSLFAYLDHKVQGNSVVSWIGPCRISVDHMVDGEDLLEGARIEGDRMVHFIVELFHTPLFAAVSVQRLFASICLDLIREKFVTSVSSSLRREGDDLYFDAGQGEGKLSISIATATPVSSLIHFAVNCTNEGTPVKTASLGDLGIEPREFAKEAMDRLVMELTSIEAATVKVRWVK